MSWFQYFANPGTLVFVIPIAAILAGGVTAVVKAVFRHRERMAMIERGMNPDFPADAGPPVEDDARRPPP